MENKMLKKKSYRMKLLSYRILLRKEPEDSYPVIVPSFSGCITYRDTIEEATYE